MPTLRVRKRCFRSETGTGQPSMKVGNPSRQAVASRASCSDPMLLARKNLRFDSIPSNQLGLEAAF